jgi:hypothetical protein
MHSVWRGGLVALVLVSLSACAGHKDLTAPCDATRGDGLFGLLLASGSAFACEPMRPINSGSADGVR